MRFLVPLFIAFLAAEISAQSGDATLNVSVVLDEVFLAEDVTVEGEAVKTGTSASPVVITGPGSYSGHLMFDGDFQLLSDETIRITNAAVSCEGACCSFVALPGSRAVFWNTVFDFTSCAGSGDVGAGLVFFGEEHFCSADVDLPGGEPAIPPTGSGSQRSHDLFQVTVLNGGGLDSGGDEKINLNSIAFYGCGKSTQVRGLRSLGCYDDCIEISGGSFNLQSVTLSGSLDDGLDIDCGFRGAFFDTIVTINSGESGSNGMEIRNRLAGPLGSCIGECESERQTEVVLCDLAIVAQDLQEISKTYEIRVDATVGVTSDAYFLGPAGAEGDLRTDVRCPPKSINGQQF